MKSVPYCPVARKKRHTINTPKSEWKKFRPDRYLYHINFSKSCQSDEENTFLHRLSFVFNGICGIDKGLGGVWANNQMKRITQLWPICYDSWGLNNIEYLDMIKCADVWRIDTSLINNTWYLDPNLIYGAERSGNADDYLYCENTVHPRALKLFKFSVNECRFLYQDKYNIDFSLKPVDRINDIIFNKWRKKKIV
jgi:hypothetical protein